jgi:enolase
MIEVKALSAYEILDCGQIKSGAPARGGRAAKYNRPIEIEATNELPYGRVK